MDILLGIILFFILFWYLMKFFIRYGLPWLIARFMKRQQSRFGKYYQQQGYEQQRPDGEVKINKDKSKKSKDDDGFGEYVDFEDLKE